MLRNFGTSGTSSSQKPGQQSPRMGRSLFGRKKEEDILESDSDEEIYPDLSLLPLSYYCPEDTHHELLKKLLMVVLKRMGVADRQIPGIVNEVEMQMVRPDRYLVDLPTQYTLVHMVEALVNPYLSHQRYLAKVILAQSVIRRTLHRRRYVLTYRHLYVNTTLGKRLDVFRNLIRGEEKYLDRITLLHRRFFRPLRRRVDDKGTYLLSSELNALFGNLPSLRRTHIQLLKRLIILRERAWPNINGVGAVFLQLMGRLGKYQEYARDFQYAMDTLERLNNRPKFYGFIKEKEAELAADKISFRKLLCSPLNRFRFYEKNLQSLIKYTPSLGHPLSSNSFVDDECELKETLVAVEEIQKLCKLASEESGRRSRILNVLRSLQFENENDKAKLDLLGDASRKFVRDGPMIHYDADRRKSERHVFMFSDLCLITRHVRAKPEDMYQYCAEDVVVYHTATIEANAEVEVLSQKAIERAERAGKEVIPIFKLIDNQHKRSHCLQSITLAESYVWFLKFNQSLERSQLVFGKPIDTVLEEEGSQVPKVIRDGLAFLQQHGLWSEGLFRIAADQKLVHDLWTRYDRAENVDLSAYGVHTVAALIKLYFRELPDSIFTFAFFDEFQKRCQDPDVINREFVEECLTQIPPSNKNVLDYLMLFLIRLCNFSKVNKMTPNNIAIVFGPTLLRPKTDTVQSSLLIPHINGFVEEMVLLYNDLYESLLFFEEDRGLSYRRDIISHAVEEREAVSEKRPKNPFAETAVTLVDDGRLMEGQSSIADMLANMDRHENEKDKPSTAAQAEKHTGGGNASAPADSAVLSALNQMDLPDNVNDIAPDELVRMMERLKAAKAIDEVKSSEPRTLVSIQGGASTGKDNSLANSNPNTTLTAKSITEKFLGVSLSVPSVPASAGNSSPRNHPSGGSSPRGRSSPRGAPRKSRAQTSSSTTSVVRTGQDDSSLTTASANRRRITSISFRRKKNRPASVMNATEEDNSSAFPGIRSHTVTSGAGGLSELAPHQDRRKRNPKAGSNVKPLSLTPETSKKKKGSRTASGGSGKKSKGGSGTDAGSSRTKKKSHTRQRSGGKSTGESTAKKSVTESSAFPGIRLKETPEPAEDSERVAGLTEEELVKQIEDDEKIVKRGTLTKLLGRGKKKRGQQSTKSLFDDEEDKS